jgi:hypothetical protein
VLIDFLFVISRTIAPPVRVAFAFTLYAGYKLKFVAAGHITRNSVYALARLSAPLPS